MAEPSTLDRVDFEIALTALLATLVTAYPAPDLAVYPVVKLAAIGLLVLTLLKRIAVLNGLTTADRPVRFVTLLMEPASSVAILYCGFVGIRTVMAWVPFLPDGAAGWGLALIIPLIVIGYLVSFELVFGDQLGEGERIIAASADEHRGETLGVYLDRYAEWVARKRAASPTSQSHESESSDHAIEELSLEEQMQAVANAVSFWLIVAAVGLVYVLIPLLAATIFAVSWMLAGALWVAVLSVTASQTLWYSRYGLLTVQDRSKYASFFNRVAPYVVIILLVS